jgi:hypothetical protein
LMAAIAIDRRNMVPLPLFWLPSISIIHSPVYRANLKNSIVTPPLYGWSIGEI